MMLFMIYLFCQLGAVLTIPHGGSIVFPDEANLLEILQEQKPNLATRNFIFENDRDTCILPSGETGMCIPFKACSELQDVVKRDGIRRSIRLLRSRICRFENRVPFLCCDQRKTSPVTASPVEPVPVRSDIIPRMHECGFITGPKIVEGEEIPVGSQPWLVGIGSMENNKFKLLCGGTLITRKHVLSAAHCFQRTPGSIRLTHILLGDHSLSQDLPGEDRTLLRIVSTTEPGYDPVSHINDIAILTLEREVTFSSAIRPACLPFKFVHKDFTDEQLLVVGWGDTVHLGNSRNDVPLAVTLEVTSKDECRNIFRNNPELPLDDTQLCAGEGTRKDACQGDSGGPMIFLDSSDTNQNFLVGIVSVGVECGNPTYPGIYTFVPPHLKWITETLRNLP